MKEKLKNDFSMLVGMVVAMCVIDVISNDSFDFMQMILRSIVTVGVYLFFRFIELKVKKIK